MNEQEKEQKLLEKGERVKEKVVNTALTIMKRRFSTLYIHVRHYVASQLAVDWKSKQPKKKKEVPPPLQYTVGDFLHEPPKHARGWDRRHYEYETLYYEYERLLTYYLSDWLPKWAIDQLSPSLLSDVHKCFGKPLTDAKLAEWLLEPLFDEVNHYLEHLQAEHVTHLLRLAELPFDFEEQQFLYEKDLAERERLKEEALMEIDRKKAEEAKMIEELFGQEYHHAPNPDIRYILHIGETNTGKTYGAIQRMKQAASGLYLAPLRLLALEIYDRLNAEGVPCSLKTGEEERLSLEAAHQASTVEMFDETDYYDVIVIDEAQMMADQERGFSWYRAITKANAREVHIIGSRNVKTLLTGLLQQQTVEVREYSRNIPLQVEEQAFRLSDTKAGDALVCFSRRRVLEVASGLQRHGHSVSMIYGNMPPETRKKQIRRFLDGETSVIVATDAIGMGLNLPIRRIVFLENEKFDGLKRRELTSQEVKQIAGRAGRKGMYPVGKVAFTKDIDHMTELLQQEDEPVSSFTIAPTNEMLLRFQSYKKTLGTFFELWAKFENPPGTKKAPLVDEQELYRLVRDTKLEERLAPVSLYRFLHLPFSANEPELVEQWMNSVMAIVYNKNVPEPFLQKDTLEELELSYQAAGLHLLFLYRLNKKKEALEWERVREGISNDIHDRLKSSINIAERTCEACSQSVSWDTPDRLCETCRQNVQAD